MADEIGELDLTAQASAAKTATNYMFFDSTNGLKIASSNPSSAERRIQIKSNGIGIYNDNNNYSYIDSNGMNIYKNGNSVAAFGGSTTRIGESDNLHMTLLNGGIRIYEKEETPFADSSTAKFTGTESVIGEVKDIHTQISSNGFGILNGETKLFSIDTEQKMTTHSQDSSREVKQLVFDEVIGEGTITNSTNGYLSGNGNVHTSTDDPEWCWISSSKLRAKPQIFLDMAQYSDDTQREWVPIEELEGYAYYNYTEPEIYDSDNYRFYFSVQIYDTSLLPVRWKIGIAHYERNLTVQIGKSNESHMELDYRSLQMVGKEGDAYFRVKDLRDNNGLYSETVGRPLGLTFAASTLPKVEWEYTITDYKVKLASDGSDDTANWHLQESNILIRNSEITSQTRYFITLTTNSEYAKSFTFGHRGYEDGEITDEMEGGLSASFGMYTSATGSASFSEGERSSASGDCSHAQGVGTAATGYSSHAEGYGTIANGNYSHAQNNSTIASSDNQTALGKYNIEDANNEYAVIIGNGADEDDPSNALAVKWNGDVEIDNGRIEISDSGWITPTINSPFVKYDNARTPRYRKLNGMVEIRGAVKPTSTTAINETVRTLFTLPEGYRPTNCEVTKLCQGSSRRIWLLTVNTNGTVMATRLRDMGATTYQSTVNNEWMIFDVVFMAGGENVS